MEAGSDEVQNLHDSWGEALRRGDLDAALDLITEDYALWAPGAPPVAGRDSVRGLLAAALAKYEVSPSSVCALRSAGETTR